jgi:hypothetical protein
VTQKQQWAFFSMGVWLTGTIALAVVATENIYTVDRLLAHSTNAPFRVAIERLGAGPGRDLLLFLSSELNRLYFQWWNALQIVLAALMLWLLRPLGPGNRAGWFVIGMLAVTLFMTLALAPPMLRIGRELDFMPREPLPPPGLRTFGLLYAAYSVFTLVNLILGVLTIRAIRGAPETS